MVFPCEAGDFDSEEEKLGSFALRKNKPSD